MVTVVSVWVADDPAALAAGAPQWKEKGESLSGLAR
jgi:hypothetical protein